MCCQGLTLFNAPASHRVTGNLIKPAHRLSFMPADSNGLSTMVHWIGLKNFISNNLYTTIMND
jgi:hypothetical protein